MELKQSVQALDERLSGLRATLDQNPLFLKTKALESKLTRILSSNEQLSSAIADIDDSFLRERVLAQAKRYNQRLQGF